LQQEAILLSMPSEGDSNILEQNYFNETEVLYRCNHFHISDIYFCLRKRNRRYDT